MTLEAPPRPRVFMAEDNEGDVTLMRAAMDEVGLVADLEVANDGASALTSLLDQRHLIPDLIILNFNLPKLRGHQLLTEIKRTPRLRDIPVVMLTSSSAEQDRLLCEHADAYFVKSGEWEDLLQVTDHLRQFLRPHPDRP